MPARRERVLVTGASSGIGAALARVFAREGSDLVLVARSSDRLQSLADELMAAHDVRVTVLPADLAVAGAPEEIVAHLGAGELPVDVLVNNAGFGLLGPFAELDPVRQLEMIQVNVSAPTHLARLLLPGMIARGRGGVLNVASAAAFQPGPLMAVYFATKAYLLHLSEALTEEVAGTGVTISCLTPGPTTTPFVDVAGMEHTRLFRIGPMTAAAVAEAGYRGFRAGRAVVVPGLRNRVIPLGSRLLPRVVMRRIAGFLNG